MARISSLIALLFTTAGLLVGAAYAAGNTSVGAYGGVGGKTQGVIHQASLGKTSGTLPFTGLNLALIAAAGILLLLTGIVLRRRGGKTNS